MLEFRGSQLWISRAKSGSALAKMAKAKEALAAIQKLAATKPSIGAAACCAGAGRVWLVESQQTVAILDRAVDAVVWNGLALARVGATVSELQEIAAEIRRGRQFL